MELKNSEHYNDPTPYEAHKNIRKEEQLEAARMRTISALVGALKQVADLAGFEIVGRVVLMDKDSASIMPNGARNSPPAENRAALRSCWQGSRGRSNHRSTRLNR